MTTTTMKTPKKAQQIIFPQTAQQIPNNFPKCLIIKSSLAQIALLEVLWPRGGVDLNIILCVPQKRQRRVQMHKLPGPSWLLPEGKTEPVNWKIEPVH